MSELLNVKDLAAASRESIAVWRKRVFLRDIDIVRCGRNVRISCKALEEWLRRRTVPASNHADGVVPVEGR